MDRVEVLGYSVLILLILIVFVRLITGRKEIIRILVVVASMSLVLSTLFNIFYLALFSSKYGVIYAAFVPPIGIIIGSHSIGGVLPGTMYLDFTSILSIYLLVELFTAQRRFKRAEFIKESVGSEARS